MKKGSGQKKIRASINFSPDIEKILHGRAETNRRSFTKEVEWIVEQFLKQEEKANNGQTETKKAHSDSQHDG